MSRSTILQAPVGSVLRTPSSREGPICDRNAPKQCFGASNAERRTHQIEPSNLPCDRPHQRPQKKLLRVLLATSSQSASSEDPHSCLPQATELRRGANCAASGADIARCGFLATVSQRVVGVRDSSGNSFVHLVSWLLACAPLKHCS